MTVELEGPPSPLDGGSHNWIFTLIHDDKLERAQDLAKILADWWSANPLDRGLHESFYALGIYHTLNSVITVLGLRDTRQQLEIVNRKLRKRSEGSARRSRT